jgi:hypothetical protein
MLEPTSAGNAVPMATRDQSSRAITRKCEEGTRPCQQDGNPIQGHVRVPPKKGTRQRGQIGDLVIGEHRQARLEDQRRPRTPCRPRCLTIAAPGHVFTISRAAKILREDEELLWDLANEMEPEDGCLWIYGTSDQQTIALESTKSSLTCRSFRFVQRSIP